MRSPFPGMDPYLEGALWPDVHLALAGEVRRRLVPLVGRRYAVRLIPTVVEDSDPGPEIGITYPMVPGIAVLARQAAMAAPAEPGSSGAARRGAVLPVTLPILDAVEVRLVTVESRDAVADRLVTAIENLSPVNKRGQGLAEYRTKRVRLRRAGVHLLEIDLLRRGERPLSHPNLPASAYLVTLTRAGEGTLAAWPIGLADALPEVPVPLRPPDEDMPLDLQATLASVYAAAAYDVSYRLRRAAATATTRRRRGRTGRARSSVAPPSPASTSSGLVGWRLEPPASLPMHWLYRRATIVLTEYTF